MPKYKAVQKGFHNGSIQDEGDVFFTDIEYGKPIKDKDGKVMKDKNGKEILRPMPSWMVPVGKDNEVTKKMSASDRKSVIKKAITDMAGEDPQRQNVDFWIANGSPEITEIHKRTNLTDISAAERDQIWDEMHLPPSGTVPQA